MYDEPVRVRISLDDLEVGVDHCADKLARMQLALERAGDRGHDFRRDTLADRGIEARPIGEVPVEDGLAGASGGGDLIHVDAGTMLAYRRDRGVDDFGPTRLPVRRPACAPAVYARRVAGGR